MVQVEEMDEENGLYYYMLIVFIIFILLIVFGYIFMKKSNFLNQCSSSNFSSNKELRPCYPSAQYQPRQVQNANGPKRIFQTNKGPRCYVIDKNGLPVIQSLAVDSSL